MIVQAVSANGWSGV